MLILMAVVLMPRMMRGALRPANILPARYFYRKLSSGGWRKKILPSLRRTRLRISGNCRPVRQVCNFQNLLAFFHFMRFSNFIIVDDNRLIRLLRGEVLAPAFAGVTA